MAKRAVILSEAQNLRISPFGVACSLALAQVRGRLSRNKPKNKVEFGGKFSATPIVVRNNQREYAFHHNSTIKKPRSARGVFAKPPAKTPLSWPKCGPQKKSRNFAHRCRKRRLKQKAGIAPGLLLELLVSYALTEFSAVAAAAAAASRSFSAFSALRAAAWF
jgi:hypothetical protein